jgi:ATP-binding cassette subfamily B protein
MFKLRQYDTQDCGPACIQIVAYLYNKDIALEQIRKLCDMSAEGTSIYDLSKAAEAFEFNTIITQIPFDALYEAPLPAIAWWRQNHFVVVERVKGDTVYVIDPSAGRLRYSRKEFEQRWAVNEEGKGFALLLEPTFEKPKKRQNNKESSYNTKYYLAYFRAFKQYYTVVGLILVAGIVLQFLLPFLSQTMIDQGIGQRNIQLINILLFAQLVIITSQLVNSIIRSWMYMHIGIRASLRTVSNFLLKLLRLPISFFSTRRVGDILQRIDDNKRIESFITGVLTETLFSFITLFVFGIVLFIYNWKLFLVFFIGSIIYILYILFFQEQRKKLDLALFEKYGESRSRLIEIIESAQEIKIVHSVMKKVVLLHPIYNVNE